MQTFQGSFTAGELSPSMLGRVDLARYSIGCKTLENMLVHPQGGASKRPGFEMLAELPDETHLVPFVFNNEQSYVLAFTEKKLRIYNRSGLLKQSDHGAWQSGDWFDQNGVKKDTPKSGTSAGQFGLKIIPEVNNYARVNSAYIVRPIEFLHLYFTLHNGPVTLEVIERGGTLLYRKSLYPGTNKISIKRKTVTPMLIDVIALSFSTLSSSAKIENLQAFQSSSADLKTISSSQDLYPHPWTGACDRKATAIAHNSYTLTLRGFIEPKIVESLTHQINIETPGVLHPMEFEVTTGSVALKVGSKKNGTDILPITVYEKGVHRINLYPDSKVMHFTFMATSTAETKFYPPVLLLGNEGDIVLDTPYSFEDAKNISHTQSADVLFLACQGYAPQKLKRYRHDSWALEAMSFECPIASPASVSASFTNGAKKSDGSAEPAQLVTPYTYVVTAVNSQGKESKASKAASITGPASNNWHGGDYMTISWPEVSGAVEYRIYKGEFGGKPGFMASATNLSYKDYNIRPVISDGPPEWQNPFPDNDYPGVVGMFEQRLVFASSRNRPQTIWLSRSGDYDNFSASNPIKADDSIEKTIASSEVSTAKWMVALRSLMLGTSSIEWEISSTEGAFTAKTMKVAPQSYRGSSSLPALVIGNTILHVGRNGSEVRDLKYDFGSDSYGGSDRTILANHLFQGHELISWAYQASPDSIIWAVRDDGILLGLTFQAEHEVFAWHKHTTQGKFKSVCCIPQQQNDDVYVVVERDGKHFLEVMAIPFLLQTVRYQRRPDNPLDAAFYLDSGLEYVGEPTKNLSGLEHLEGKEVSILADGAVMAPRIVQDGKIELDTEARHAVVGLSYNAKLETMPVEIIAQDGNSLGRKKQIHSLNVLFQSTVTAQVGRTFKRLEELKWRSNEPMGSPLNPKSEWQEIKTTGLAESMAGACIQSSDPLPMTVLAVVPELDIK